MGMQTLGLKEMAVVLIVVSLTLTLGVLIAQEIRDSDSVDTQTTQSLANTTYTNSSLITLEPKVVTGTIVIYNGTYTGGATTASTVNLTCTGWAPCTIALNNYETGIEEAINFTLTYNYVTRDENFGYNITGEGLDALDTTAGFIPIIAIVIVAGVIVGVVTGAFKGSV